jgi:WD40 repeat protein
MLTHELPTKKAIGTLESILLRYPESSYTDYARFALARAQLAEGKIKEAIQHLENTSADFFPFRASALILLRRIYIQHEPSKVKLIEKELNARYSDAIEWRQELAAEMTPEQWRNLEAAARTPVARTGSVRVAPSLSLTHRSPIFNVASSKDGTLIAAGGARGTISVWQYPQGKLVSRTNGPDAHILSLDFSPSSGDLAALSAATVQGSGSVLLCDRRNGTIRRRVPFERTAPLSLSYSPDGGALAVGMYYGPSAIWDPAIRIQRTTLGLHDDIRSIAFSPDGKKIATASLDKTVKIWNSQSGQELAHLAGHVGGILCVSFSPDGKMIATASADRTAKLWDASTFRELATLEGHKDIVSSVTFSPDSRLLATGSSDTGVKLWSTSTFSEHSLLAGHLDAVSSLIFLPSNKKLASGSIDGTVKLWEIP